MTAPLCAARLVCDCLPSPRCTLPADHPDADDPHGPHVWGLVTGFGSESWERPTGELLGEHHCEDVSVSLGSNYRTWRIVRVRSGPKEQLDIFARRAPKPKQERLIP